MPILQAMIRRLFIAAVLALTAVSAEAKAEKKEEGAAAPKDVDLTPVAVPVIVQGQVRNYIFVTVRITPSDNTDSSTIRQFEPLLRDAVVRAAHTISFAKADNYNMVDEPRVIGALSPRFGAIVGAGKIKSVSIPKQQPKNVVRIPKRS